MESPKTLEEQDRETRERDWYAKTIVDKVFTIVNSKLLMLGDQVDAAVQNKVKSITLQALGFSGRPGDFHILNSQEMNGAVIEFIKLKFSDYIKSRVAA